MAREAEGGHEASGRRFRRTSIRRSNELPEPMRTLLVRHYFYKGTPQAELAEEAGASPEATISLARSKPPSKRLQKLLRKKGLYVSLIAAQAKFCARTQPKPRAPQLLSELGKMRMVGRLKLKLHRRRQTRRRQSGHENALAAALSGAAIVAMIGIAAVIWSAHPHNVPAYTAR